MLKKGVPVRHNALSERNAVGEDKPFYSAVEVF